MVPRSQDVRFLSSCHFVLYVLWLVFSFLNFRMKFAQEAATMDYLMKNLHPSAASSLRDFCRFEGPSHITPCRLSEFLHKFNFFCQPTFNEQTGVINFSFEDLNLSVEQTIDRLRQDGW